MIASSIEPKHSASSAFWSGDRIDMPIERIEPPSDRSRWKAGTDNVAILFPSAAHPCHVTLVTFAKSKESLLPRTGENCTNNP